MKISLIAAVVVLCLGLAHLAAADKPADSKTPATTQAAPSNKKCPISGDDVDPKGKTVTYKGKTVGFCCDDCIEKWEKEPDKYAKKLK